MTTPPSQRSPVPGITHLYFDIGGVLGTGGWSTDQRALAVERFHLDGDDFDRRHREVVGMWELGMLSMDEYLDHTVFDVPRPFSRAEFSAFMFDQSAPNPEMIALVRGLAAAGRYRLMTINNESDALNRHRLERFGLGGIFDAYFSSCWLGVAKPARRIYELALAMAGAEPARSVFIDDRDQNLGPAAALGMHVILFRSPGELRASLAGLGVG